MAAGSRPESSSPAMAFPVRPDAAASAGIDANP